MAEPIWITDPDDPRAMRFRLRDRQLAPRQPAPNAPQGLFVAEGDLVVERALDSGYVLDSVLADPRRRPACLARIPEDTPVLLADIAVRERLTGFGVQLDVAALFHRRPLPSVDRIAAGGRRIAVLEAVDNPANLGAIVRSAAALGIDAVLVDPTGADPYARRCVRTSMGTSLRLPIGRATALPDGLTPLRVAGFTIAAFSPSGTIDLTDLALEEVPRIAVLLGSERGGLTEATKAGADLVVRIPMATGVDSLNVAAAAAIVFYAIRAAGAEQS